MTPRLYVNSCYPSIRFVWLPLWIEYRPRDHFYKWPVFRRGVFDLWIGFGMLRVRWHLS